MATKKVNYKDEYVYQEGQTFPLVEDELKYNAETDSLDVVGKIDLQEQLNSFRETALDAMLERFNFLGGNGGSISLDPDAVQDFYETPDLLDLAENREKIEQYKLELGLPWYYTDEEVIAYIEAMAQNKEKDVKTEEVKKDETSNS